MLTPQEVSGHAFTKAVMGGYNMAMVDEFLDELTDDYTALYKENAVLKAKMKVLVEKVEDYRATEDSMRATLLTAQKMADSIVREAEDKREQLLRETQKQAEEKVGALRHEMLETQERLRMGQQELQLFVERVRAVYDKEMLLLQQLPQMPVSVPGNPAQTAPAAEIEGKIMDSFRQETAEPVPAFAPQSPARQDSPTRQLPRQDESPTRELPRQDESPTREIPRQESPARELSRQERLAREHPRQVSSAPELPGQESLVQAEPPAPQEEKAEEFPYPEGNPFVPMDEATRKVNLDDLKFGRNYNREG